jgi:hypothetical protein
VESLVLDGAEHPEQLSSVEREELKRLRKENSELKRANEIPKAASAPSPPSSASPGRSSHGGRPLRDRFGVEPVCRVLDLCPGT